ncbi:hypothetical protein KY315_04255 [Candidatus Woesearchaeota archaeon]|nr:hypothetical protein [Candidatus Woesearchaeota archaeon]
MRTAQIFYLVVVAFFAVVIIFQSVPSEPMGNAIKQSWGVYVPNALDIRSLIIPSLGLAIERPAMPGDLPAEAKYIPSQMEFYVDSIIVPEHQAYDFLPIPKDDMRTFSGKFGPYPEDYRNSIYVELCAFVLSQPEMEACEKMRDTTFRRGYISFARGYDWDEYIASLGMRNFGAYYKVMSPEFGEIAKSNVAKINLV